MLIKTIITQPSGRVWMLDKRHISSNCYLIFSKSHFHQSHMQEIWLQIPLHLQCVREVSMLSPHTHPHVLWTLLPQYKQRILRRFLIINYVNSTKRYQKSHNQNTYAQILMQKLLEFKPITVYFCISIWEVFTPIWCTLHILCEISICIFPPFTDHIKSVFGSIVMRCSHLLSITSW